MDYFEFMYSIKHNDDSILNLSKNGIRDVLESCDNDVSLSNILKNSIGGVIELWDEESCDDFFLGADPYIPLY